MIGVEKTFFATWILLLPLFVCAQEGRADLLSTTKGEVYFVSDAPLELIKASTSEIRGLIDPAKRTFAFIIPNSSFKGFNSPLQQEHFYENYIEAEKYPSSTFEGKIIEDVDFSTAGKHLIRAKGILIIHGIKQERVIKVDLEISDGKVIALSNFEIVLADHDITIPKMVYQKIAESIHVSVALEFERKE